MLKHQNEVSTIQLWQRPNTTQSFPSIPWGPFGLPWPERHKQRVVKSMNLNPTALVWGPPPRQLAPLFSHLRNVGNSPLNFPSHTVDAQRGRSWLLGLQIHLYVPFLSACPILLSLPQHYFKTESALEYRHQERFHERPRNLVLREGQESREEEGARYSWWGVWGAKQRTLWAKKERAWIMGSRTTWEE